MAYDKNNIFAKILRGEIALNANEKIYENEFVFSFLVIYTYKIPQQRILFFDE